MITTTLNKKTFWTKIGKLYQQLENSKNSSFVIIPKEDFDPHWIAETAKNKKAYQQSIKGLNQSYSLDDAYSLIMQGNPIKYSRNVTLRTGN